MEKEDKEENKELEKFKKELEAIKKKADENLAGWKRALADFSNFKKEKESEQKEFVKFSQASLILEILPILDNFDAAWKTLPKDLESGVWVKGIGHVKSQLANLLKSKGVEEIGKAGEEFNPEIHEAVEKNLKSTSQISKLKTANQNSKIIVTEIMQKGYKLHEKVIRPAKVRVS